MSNSDAERRDKRLAEIENEGDSLSTERLIAEGKNSGSYFTRALARRAESQAATIARLSVPLSENEVTPMTYFHFKGVFANLIQERLNAG